MSSDLFEIPLFPFSVVLFPQSRFPLHIFEDRYKLMIRHCLEKNGVFGINLMVDDAIRPVGCTVRVAEVQKVYDDGRMDIVVEGENRYEVRRQSMHPEGYLLGAVVFLPDDGAETDAERRAEAEELFHEALRAAGQEREGEAAPAPMSAYAMAEKSGMEVMERQTLLEERVENRRLAMVAEHLRRLIPRIEEAAVKRRLVINDGYLTRRS